MDAWLRWLGIAVMALPACAMAQRQMELGNWHTTTHVTTNGKAEPVQVQDECLGDELKDLAAYFSLTKTAKERAVVVAKAEGNHTGACKL